MSFVFVIALGPDGARATPPLPGRVTVLPRPGALSWSQAPSDPVGRLSGSGRCGQCHSYAFLISRELLTLYGLRERSGCAMGM
jgi:hypothetical protein